MKMNREFICRFATCAVRKMSLTENPSFSYNTEEQQIRAVKRKEASEHAAFRARLNTKKRIRTFVGVVFLR